MSELVTILGHPYFLRKEAKALQLLCNTLIDGMKNYLDFLNQQKERSHVNHQQIQTFKGLNNKWSLRKTEVSEGIPSKYVKLHQSLLKMEPCATFSQMIGMIDEIGWKKYLCLLVKVYSHRLGNY